MSLCHHSDNFLFAGAQLKAISANLGQSHQQIPLSIDFGIHHDNFRAVAFGGIGLAVVASSYVYKVSDRVANRRLLLFDGGTASDEFLGDGHDILLR
jgi:hypothetical protein